MCFGQTRFEVFGFQFTFLISAVTRLYAMNRNVGLAVVIAGAVLMVLGLLIYSGALSWFGRLPGDIRYETQNTRVYFPIVSSLLASIALSVLFYLFRRFF